MTGLGVILGISLASLSLLLLVPVGYVGSGRVVGFLVFMGSVGFSLVEGGFDFTGITGEVPVSLVEESTGEVEFLVSVGGVVSLGFVGISGPIGMMGSEIPEGFMVA